MVAHLQELAGASLSEATSRLLRQKRFLRQSPPNLTRVSACPHLRDAKDDTMLLTCPLRVSLGLVCLVREALRRDPVNDHA